MGTSTLSTNDLLLVSSSVDWGGAHPHTSIQLVGLCNTGKKHIHAQVLKFLAMCCMWAIAKFRWISQAKDQEKEVSFSSSTKLFASWILHPVIATYGSILLCVTTTLKVSEQNNIS